MNKNVVCYGEVLWDLLPQGARVGGAPLNVCYHLNKQGVNSKIISQVGNDVLGNDLLQAIKDLEIDPVFCAVSSEYPTSRVDVELDDAGKPTYTIVENVAWDYIPFDNTVAAEISNSDAFIFGSLVLRNPISMQTLRSYLNYSNYVVMDVNLRAPFYDVDILKEFLSYVDCLKINDDELLLLGKWLGALDLTESNCLTAILNAYPKIKEIILTKGANGSLYYSNGEHFIISAYAIDVQDTVGAGDAFLAGFLAHKLNDEAIEFALEFATLLSAFVASKDGACPLYTYLDLINFKNQHRKVL